MDDFVKAFVKASVAWLGIGVVLGMAMAIVPEWTVYRAMHVHVMLLGFVTMFINGVGYHVVPRLSGRPLWSIPAARRHWWIANAGLCLMIAGFYLRASGSSVATGILSAGGLITAVGAFIFILQVWLTVDAPPPVETVRRAASLPMAPR
jgi:cbb3-type cytochrome oxidase subunit 1